MEYICIIEIVWKMISIIVCSINDDLRNHLHQNITENIGCDFEFLYTDNRINPRGICAVYNKLAFKAKGEYLCFMHEDVLIETKNWGEKLISKASDKKTGVLGFAGAGLLSVIPYWNDRHTQFACYKQYLKNGELFEDLTLNKPADNVKVAVLDGMFLFCRKEVWENHPFDEHTFPGFHLYDIDFTLSVAQQYTNYVDCDVVIAHYSMGSLDRAYYDGLIDFYNKWKAILPYSVNPEIIKDNLDKILRLNLKDTVREMIKRTDLPNSYILHFLRSVSLLENGKDYRRAMKYIIKSRLKKIIKKVPY